MKPLSEVLTVNKDNEVTHKLPPPAPVIIPYDWYIVLSGFLGRLPTTQEQLDHYGAEYEPGDTTNF